MRTGQNIYKRKDRRWEARVFLGKKSNDRPHFFLISFLYSLRASILISPFLTS